MADEVTSHNVEELALCVRFVDSDCNIREEFINFMRVSRITGDVIASTLLTEMEDMGLNLSYLVGQGYDGAANMSSARVGVQGRIKQEAPLATYMHCSGHALNLVIAHSCSTPCIRNAIDKLRQICMFFNMSPKRNGLLVDIIEKSVKLAGRKPLLDVCRTRWAERHDAYTHFYNAYPFIVQAFEVMTFGDSCSVECDPDFRSGWDVKTKSDAQSYLTAITTFEFIVTFLCVYQLLSHLAGITVKLQSTSIDILKAYADVSILSTNSLLKSNMSVSYKKIVIGLD